MEIIKNKNGLRYRDCVYVNGKKVNSPFFDRKLDCQNWKNRKRSEIAQSKALGLPLEAFSKMTFSDFAKEWLLVKKAHGIKASSYGKYLSNLNVHLLPYFGNADLKNITLKRGEDFVRSIQNTHSPKGINIIVAVLKQVMDEALRKGLIGRNPIADLKLQSQGDQLVNYWTAEEINIFLRSNRESPLFPLFVIAINTGMRKGELGGLKWDRVDFINRSIIVSRTRDQLGLSEMTKMKITRHIPMNEIVFRTLHDIKMKNSGTEYVFTYKGEPINVHHLYRDFKIAQKKSGLEKRIRFHDLRHTFASNFVMNGGNIFDLQKILGHTNMEMTQRYAHLSQEHLRKSMSVMNFGSEVVFETLSQIHPKPFLESEKVVLSAVN